MNCQITQPFKIYRVKLFLNFYRKWVLSKHPLNAVSLYSKMK